MATPSADESALRDELRALGERRRQHDAQADTLARETGEVVRRAKRLRLLPMTEVAALLGLDRAYLYRRARKAV